MIEQINPRNEIIYGFENKKSIENIISIMIGMILGDKIPPVVLLYSGKKWFDLGLEGGHHRCIAGYLLNKNINYELKFGDLKNQRLISQIELVMAPSYFNFFYRDRRSLPPTKEFFSKYPMINEALKYGTNKDYSFTPESYQKMLDNLKKVA